eukprot:1920075-Rhodomonas_salina.4
MISLYGSGAAKHLAGYSGELADLRGAVLDLHSEQLGAPTAIRVSTPKLHRSDFSGGCNLDDRGRAVRMRACFDVKSHRYVRATQADNEKKRKRRRDQGRERERKRLGRRETQTERTAARWKGRKRKRVGGKERRCVAKESILPEVVACQRCCTSTPDNARSNCGSNVSETQAQDQTSCRLLKV